MTTSESSHQPWGFYEVLANETDHKIKRITVNPGERLSLQRHQKRMEHWYVVAGQAIATLGDKQVLLKVGEAVDVPVKTIHRVENKGTQPFVFIEIQRGEYFGEDDIERFEDDYGRI
jgi:mannose-6-phosphate isomerase-like protein (cupin superfamily)